MEAHSRQQTADRKNLTEQRQLIFSFAVCCVLCAVCWFWVQTTAWACPWCQDALFAPGEAAAKSGMAKGYAWSIAALLGVPTLLVGTTALAIIRAVRRTKR